MTETTPDATASTAAPAAAEGVLTHRQILVVLSGLLLGMFLSALDQTVVSTAMRTIADKLDGQTAQAWVATAYLITATVSTPLYGKLSDIYGRKRFYLFAIAVFVIGSMLCGTSQSIYELAAFRAVQGVGAGGLMALAFAIIGDMVPPRERGRYQGYFMMVFGSSSVLGPVIGGFLAGQESILGVAGWRWIFYINVPIGVAAIAIVARVLNLPHHRLDHRIDYIGAALLTVGVVPLLIVAERGVEWGWGSALSLSLIAVGVVALIGFVAWELRMGDEAILPMRFFRNSVFTVTTAVGFVMGMGMFGGMMSLPLYLQIVRGQSPTQAGLSMLPLVIGIMAASGLAGQAMSRTGRYKVFPIVGTGLMLLSMLMFSTLGVHTPVPLIVTYMFVMGTGLGLSMQTLIVAVQNALPPRDMGVSTSSSTFFRSMGGTFGAAAFLSILFSSVGGNIKDRFAALQSADPAGLKAAMGELSKAQLAKLQSAGGQGSSSSLNNTEFITALPRALKNVFLGGFADSMHAVYLVAALVMLPAFVLSFFIEEIPLRAHGGIAAGQAERAAEAAERAGAAQPVVTAEVMAAVAAAPDDATGADRTRPEAGVEAAADVVRSETTVI